MRLQLGSKVDYYINKQVLIEKCPFFAKHQPLRRPGCEPQEEEVPLFLHGCTEESLDAFAYYLYRGSYVDIVKGESDTKCATHAYVYVLAERMFMDELQQQALTNMAREFEALRPRKLSAEAVMRLQRIVYYNTDDRRATQEPEICANGVTENTINESAPTRPVNKMRNLIAYYTSSMVSDMRKNQSFLDTLETRSEFREDLLVHLPDRTSLDYGPFC